MNDKLILVHYINIGNVNRATAQQEMYHYLEMIQGTGNDITHYVLPVKDPQKTKIECINPKLITEEEYVNVKTILDRNTKILNEYLASDNKEWFVKTWFRKCKLFRLKNDK